MNIDLNVVSQKTGEPIEGAAVRLMDGDKPVWANLYTDGNGDLHAPYEHRAEHSYYLIVSVKGFKEGRIDVAPRPMRLELQSKWPSGLIAIGSLVAITLVVTIIILFKVYHPARKDVTTTKDVMTPPIQLAKGPTPSTVISVPATGPILATDKVNPQIPAPKVPPTLVIKLGDAGPLVAGKRETLSVIANDPQGQPISYSGTVQYTSDPPDAYFQPDPSVRGESQVMYNTAGHKTITATDISNASLTGKMDVKIVAGPPSVAVFTRQPTAAKVNESIGEVDVTLKDEFGNIADVALCVAVISLADTHQDVLIGTKTVDVRDGVAHFQDLKVKQSGDYKLHVDFMPPIGVKKSTSDSFTINP